MPNIIEIMFEVSVSAPSILINCCAIRITITMKNIAFMTNSVKSDRSKDSCLVDWPIFVSFNYYYLDIECLDINSFWNRGYFLPFIKKYPNNKLVNTNKFKLRSSSFLAKMNRFWGKFREVIYKIMINIKEGISTTF